MGYREGNKELYLSPTNWKGKEEYIEDHFQEWDVH